MKYLKAKVVEICEKYIIAESNNIGYQVFVINSMDFVLDQEHTILIHKDQKLDKSSRIVTHLFGFLKKQQLSFFLFLLSIHGVGSKIALNILKNDVADLCELIKSNDINGMVKFNGITLRIATSIVEEINKSKKSSQLMHDKAFNDQVDFPIYQEIVDALKQIGYEQGEIKDCMIKLVKDKDNISNLDDAINRCIKIIISLKSNEQACNI